MNRISIHYRVLIILIASLSICSSCKFDEKTVITDNTRRTKRELLISCAAPSDCTNHEVPLCCLSASLLDATSKKFPDTLKKEQRGFCAKSCDDLATKIISPTKICTEETASKICAPDEKCSNFNAAASNPIGYCEKRCSSPSECGGDSSHCCLSAGLVDGATKKFPDTLTEAQKGLCAASCQEVVGKVDNPIKICTAATASTDCAADESCVNINAAAPTPIGYCEKRCFSPQECGSETPSCCLSADHLDSATRKFPDTLTTDQKGYCAANCQDVAGKLNDHPIRVCKSATDCAEGESCTHINSGTPAIGYCEKRCVSPEECGLSAKCCISSGILQDGKRLPDTIPDDQKGYCAADCGEVSGTVKDPIKLCTQRTESYVCDILEGEICTYLNHASTPIGQCVKSDKIKCTSDRDCSFPGLNCSIPGSELSANSARSTYHTFSYRGPAEGSCRRLQPRDICIFKDSKISTLSDGIDVAAITNARSATPYCYPSRFDRPDSNSLTDPSPYGRVAFLCATDTQCAQIGNFICYGKDAHPRNGTTFPNKPVGVGVCQPTLPSSCDAQKGKGSDCAPKGLTCCRAYPGHGNEHGLYGEWYCADTTVTDGSCFLFDSYRNASVKQEHFGRCDPKTNYPCSQISDTLKCDYVDSVGNIICLTR